MVDILLILHRNGTHKKVRDPNKWFKDSERHHILPKCLGGIDSKDNLIYLTPREHFVAHKLLTEENPHDSKLQYSYLLLSTHKGSRLTEYDYEEYRIKASKVYSETLSRENNPFYGKTHTEESKLMMSLTHQNVKLSESHKANISKSMKEASKSQRHIENFKKNTSNYRKQRSEGVFEYSCTCTICGIKFYSKGPTAKTCFKMQRKN